MGVEELLVLFHLDKEDDSLVAHAPNLETFSKVRGIICPRVLELLLQALLIGPDPSSPNILCPRLSKLKVDRWHVFAPSILRKVVGERAAFGSRNDSTRGWLTSVTTIDLPSAQAFRHFSISIDRASYRVNDLWESMGETSRTRIKLEDANWTSFCHALDKLFIDSNKPEEPFDLDAITKISDPCERLARCFELLAGNTEGRTDEDWSKYMEE